MPLTLPSAVRDKPVTGSVLDLSHPLASGLRWCFPFNDGSGSKILNLGNVGGFGQAALSTGVLWRGQSVFVDGSATAYIEFQNSIGSPELTLTGDLTIMTRFLYTGTGNTLRTLVGDNVAGGSERQASIYLDGNAGAKKITFWHGTGQIGQPVVCQGIRVIDTAPRWWTVTVARTGINGAWNAVIYLDGVLDATGTSTLSVSSAVANQLRIGRAGSFASAPMIGYYDDVWVWNRCLNASEVLEMYSNRWSVFESPTYRRWFLPPQIATGITFDAASNSGYQAAASTYNWNHTCTGTNRFLAVDIALLSAGQTVTGITYNGVAMSLIGAQTTVTSFGRVESWGLANPASGTNVIAVTLSGSIASAGTAVSYAQVHQTSPTANFNSAQATNVGAADATVTITTVATGSWVHAAVATDDGAITAGNTTRNNVTGVGGSGADEDTNGLVAPGTTAMLYTNVGALATWAIGGYELRPDTASSLATGGGRPLVNAGLVNRGLVNGGLVA